jgi:ubiquinone/menaquinone biosynthesis C-methylase UbiE
VNLRDAVSLIRDAVPRLGGGATWADLGAGDGTFTRALAELLGSTATIYAVDRDTRALAALKRFATKANARVVPVEADFAVLPDLPGLGGQRLDGMLLANALHFVRDAEAVLERLVRLVRPRGRVVIVEYDRRAASRWVPYPIPAQRLPSLAAAAGLSTPVVVATRPSAFGGVLYAAAADRS